MTRTKLLFLLIGLCMVAGCGTKKDKPPVEVRLANFLVGPASATIELTDGEGNTHSTKLDYGSYGEYMEVPEGVAKVRVKAKDRLVLTTELGIGKGSSFTLAVRGLAKEQRETERLTTKAQLLEVFEGATGSPANGALPMLNTYCDRFEGAKESGQLKITHLTPGFAPLEVFIRKKEGMKSVGKAAYPKTTDMKSIKPGSYEVEVRYAGSPLVLYSGQLRIDPGVLTTLAIIPRRSSYADKVQVVTMEKSTEP
ncbi:hypothetical protein AB9P05_13290 [Roseivirga sp. BDSF3-8]|uniref:hypothetical protein n=1 Tax=Roseivirga sp. BDSF3-8 TaxID=3241598 RepID=UPI003531D841